MSTAPRRPPRQRAWHRLLVLLLALLVPGAHVQARAVPVPLLVAGAAEHEHEVPGTVAWPSVPAADRAGVLRRAAPRPGAAPRGPARRPGVRPRLAVRRPPHAASPLRTVFLCC